MVDIRNLALVVHRNEELIAQFRLLAGWRIFVINVAESRMTLNQSTQYCRVEWLVERGFHRFKRGHIPVLPLFLRLPEKNQGADADVDHRPSGIDPDGIRFPQGVGQIG